MPIIKMPWLAGSTPIQGFDFTPTIDMSDWVVKMTFYPHRSFANLAKDLY